LLQGTAAATLAWVIAKHVVDHHEPFFAPIAAVVALNAPLGERGLNAVRLLEGVVVGIIAGELAVAGLGDGYGPLALATFVAMSVAHALGGARIVIAQAAASAILTVAVADGQVGGQRLVDALIGGGVALLFSQLLFSPEPVALLRRAEAAALATIAEALELTARGLEKDDDDLTAQALSRLRDLRDRLAALGRTRDASRRVARRSAVWRGQRTPVVQEDENAGQLDLLGGSCVVLTRIAANTSPARRDKLAPILRALADALTDLAKDPGGRASRQRAADRALAVARGLPSGDPPPEPERDAAIFAVRMIAADIMIFAGVDSGQAQDAMSEDTGELEVPTPAPAPRVPFNPGRWRATP
jgi:uncharacterized membrane protein YgaE (UPF0421/DUF939 family)